MEFKSLIQKEGNKIIYLNGEVMKSFDIKNKRFIISKISESNGSRLYWDGKTFLSTYLRAEQIGMTPKLVSIEQYIDLRKTNQEIFSDTALLDKKGNCVLSMNNCISLILIK